MEDPSSDSFAAPAEMVTTRAWLWPAVLMVVVVIALGLFGWLAIKRQKVKNAATRWAMTPSPSVTRNLQDSLYTVTGAVTKIELHGNEYIVTLTSATPSATYVITNNTKIHNTTDTTTAQASVQDIKEHSILSLLAISENNRWLANELTIVGKLKPLPSGEQPVYKAKQVCNGGVCSAIIVPE